MIDLHTHILPGLDDGAQSLEQALEMARVALEGGAAGLVATPHSNQLGQYENYETPQLRQNFGRLKAALEQEGLPLRLYRGMEIFADETVGERIRRGELISLNGSRYYLVEFAFDVQPQELIRGLEQVQTAGGVPLVAHPERYFCVQRDPAQVYGWLEMGCYTQINKGSLFGRFGRGAAWAADWLLHYDLVTCTASDGHQPHIRRPYLGDVRDYLIDRYGRRLAARLTEENPARILGDETLELHGRLPRSAWSGEEW